MLKYESTLITFTEIPQEISLCFNITQCPCHCENCFEPWLREDYGTPLTIKTIDEEIDKHKNFTCICFMGGDADHQYLHDLITKLKARYPFLRWAMYSGIQTFDSQLGAVLDYYKCGPFIPSKGPLNQKTTNQIYWVKQSDGSWQDQTYLFQKEKI